MTRAEMVQALEDTRAANGMTTDAHARLMVTRGVKSRPFQHPGLSKQGPTVAIIMEHSALDPAPDPPCNRAAYARPADDPRPQAEFPFPS